MTDRYAVMGNPIAHSKSPLIHTSFAQSTQQDLSYTRIEVPFAPEGAFAEAVQAFAQSGGMGLNITMPFKLMAHRLADELSERAALAKAVNILKFESGRILADNSDGEGLVTDIDRNLHVSIEGKRVLLLGAGGAARGAVWPLLQRKPALLLMANRTLSKAHSIADDFAHASFLACDMAALAYEAAFDIVINATSTGLLADSMPLPTSLFAPHTLAYDMVYGQGLTPFLRQAREAGAAQLADGAGMLVEQAAIAFAWWRGVRPDTQVVLAQLRTPLV